MTTENTESSTDTSTAVTVQKPAVPGQVTSPVKVDRTRPAKVFGMDLPQGGIFAPISTIIYNVNDAGNVWRFNVIHALPNAIVNHSSNVIGSVQLVAEALMFKAGGFNLWEKDVKKAGVVVAKVRPGANPINWVLFPIQNIYGAVFEKAKFQGKLSDLFTPQGIKDSFTSFVDLEKASKIDSHNGVLKLTNRWSARSGFSGITAMTVATLLPEQKDTPEGTEKMAIMAKQNFVGYAGQRVVQAVTFPFDTVRRLALKAIHPSEHQGIGTNKRQFAGLGMMSAGFCSVISGFRQVEGKVIGNQKYMKNPWQMAGGAITLLAGSQLMLDVDNEQGWTDYGATQLWRMIPLVPSITTRFKPTPSGLREQGAEWYLAAQGGLQFKNVVASSIGGAEKLDDGTMIDHQKERTEAIDKAIAQREEKKLQRRNAKQHDESPEAPANAVTHVASREEAMPERVAAFKQRQEEQGAPLPV